MNTSTENDLTKRNYNTISPTAKSLLLLKGLTNIPYARQAAELISYPEKYVPDFSRKDMMFWARVLHFEIRYWSIDQLLADIPVKNILELSAGFSFRGLETVKQSGYHYIDTDLPEIINIKKEFTSALQAEKNEAKSRLELLPLNALDEMQFTEIVSHFPEGEIAIVNEGLLMYLGNEEKIKLCKIIHKILKQRGGYWITADIYIKSEINKLVGNLDGFSKKFFEEHNIEENKFDSFKSAEDFFNNAGFIVDKAADVDYKQLSAFKYLKENINLWQIFKMRKAGKIHQVWRLRIADNN